MSNTTITETCGCGATFTLTTTYASTASQLADEWRRDHRHAESVGICGDRPSPLMISDVEVSRPWCELKAGHTGAHSDGEGHWMHTDEPTACAGRCACGEAVPAEVEEEGS